MQPLTRLLKPSLTEVIVYAFSSLAILVAGSLTSVVRHLSGTDLAPSPNQVIQFQIDSWPQASAVMGRVSVGLFWMAAGAGLYILAWLMANLAITIHNYYVYATKYSHPPLLTHPHWLANISRWGLRLSVFAFTVFYFNALLQFVIPVTVNLFRLFTTSIAEPMSWLALFLAAGGLFVALYAIPILLRLIALRPRIFESPANEEPA